MNQFDCLLSHAIGIAAIAHEYQTDKGGKPYILHPLRVMMKFEDPEIQIIAVLHDVLEDSGLTLESMVDIFGEYIAYILDLLTCKKDQSYRQYIKRLCENEIARKVKLADLEDNLDLTRLSIITDDDVKRIEKYKEAVKYIISKEKDHD